VCVGHGLLLASRQITLVVEHGIESAANEAVSVVH
jgi:hypothetical protein